MTDRHTVDSITSDALDALYRRIETLEHVAAGNKRHVQLIVPELERAEAAVARIRAAVHIADDQDVTDWQRGYRACAERAIAALDQPAPIPAPAPSSWLAAGTRDLSIPTQHAFTARPVDPETERAATDRAAQAAADSEKSAAWFAAHSQPAPAATEATDTRKES